MGTNKISSKGLRAGVMAASIALMVGITGCDDKPEQTVEVKEKPFDANEFRWPEFIQMLYEGNLEAARQESADVILLEFLYLNDINEFFSDPGMNAFFDSRCFSDLYEPEMKAKLTALLWGDQIPKSFLNLISLLMERDRQNDISLETRYPFLASILNDLREQIPQGRLERLMYVANIRSIFRDFAKKDAMMLFNKYGCDSEVTRAVYTNAARFVGINKIAIPSQNELKRR